MSRYPRRLRAAFGDQPDRHADGMPSAESTLAEVARRHDIAIIENDVLGPLVEDRPPPIAAFRAGTHALRHQLHQDHRAGSAHRLSRRARPLCRSRRQPPSRLQLDGDAHGRRDRLEMGGRRHRHGTGPLAAGGAGAAPGHRRRSAWAKATTVPIRQACICGCRCRASRTEEGFVAQARLQGVAIAPGASFRISDAPWQPAVRISLGSTTEGELRAGLGVIARLLLGEPEHLLLAI